MERIAFLLEETGERVSAMLNPESLTVQRTAGVRPQSSMGGALTGNSLTDDPLLFTGGGRTELQLDLLFDVDIAGSTIESSDVRDLTSPFWRLAENAQRDGYGQPPLARFVWGKAWNVPGVVVSVAERFERFTVTGEPRRSWLRMRFVRVSELPATTVSALSSETESGSLLETPEGMDSLLDTLPGYSSGNSGAPLEVPEEEATIHQLMGSGTEGERLPQLAEQYLSEPDRWRWLAWWNGIVHPLQMVTGTLIRVPPISFLQR